jgi:hypothetical protein
MFPDVELHGDEVVLKSLVSQAKELAEEHEQFHEQVIVGGRKALYAMLAKILALVKKFDASVDKTELISFMRQEMQNNHGIRTQENTSDIAVIVRYITRADRKTTHVYVRAIESALESGTQVEYFPAFLERNGGVERIRAVGVSGSQQELAEKRAKEKIEQTLAFLRARTEIPFATFDAPEKFSGIYSNSCEFEYVICCQVGNKYRVVGKLPAEIEVENYAIKQFSKIVTATVDADPDALPRLVEKAKQKRQERIGRHLKL